MHDFLAKLAEAWLLSLVVYSCVASITVLIWTCMLTDYCRESCTARNSPSDGGEFDLYIQQQWKQWICMARWVIHYNWPLFWASIISMSLKSDDWIEEQKYKYQKVPNHFLSPPLSVTNTESVALKFTRSRWHEKHWGMSAYSFPIFFLHLCHEDE